MTGSTARRSVLIFAAVCAAVQACTPTPDGPYFPADEDLRDMLRYLVEDGEAKGIVLGILEPGGSTRVVSYGRADEAGTPLSPQSSFEIGSITKTFTATLLADMVARGRVSLGDPVSKYLPPEVQMPTFGDREITLVDLATHTSGLSDPVMQAELSSRGVEDALAVPVGELFAMLSGYELSREPGTVVEYSNGGMGLLGLALGRANGRSLPALVQERILEPLGMTQTAYDLEEVPVESQVQGFYGERAVPPVVNSSALDGAGGLRSNVEDMLRFLAANVGAADTDLERAMRDAQGARHSTGAGSRNMGLAWSTVVSGGRELIEHSGDTDGFTTQIAFDPEREVGVVLLTNSREYGNNLATDLLVHGPTTTLAEATPGIDVLGRLSGTYLIEGMPWAIRLGDEGYLTVQPSMDVRMRLYALSDTMFFTKREVWSFAFPRDTAADQATITMYVNGRARSGQRVAAEAPSPRFIAGNVDLSLSDEDFARYQGVYDVDFGNQTGELTVYGAQVSGRLMSIFAGTLTRLIPAGEHEFTVVVNPSIRLSFSVEDGRAERVTLLQGDGSNSGPRRR